MSRGRGRGRGRSYLQVKFRGLTKGKEMCYIYFTIDINYLNRLQMINYKKGNCLQDSDEKRIILHIVNNKGGFGKGFALSVGNKYPIVSNRYKDWYRGSILKSDTNFKLGNIQSVKISSDLTIINMLCQNGYASKLGNGIPLSYHALKLCLEKVQFRNKDKIQIWMPKIGSGLAGGNWNTIEKMIESTLINTNVTVFEL